MKLLDTNLRLSPKTGRTVQVNPAAPYDLALKLRRLGKLVQNDQIRKMERRGAFHERGGLKRKRLKMERWRVRFGDAFRSIIRRVRQLAKKGW